jgi:hypothetical protein
LRSSGLKGISGAGNAGNAGNTSLEAFFGDPDSILTSDVPSVLIQLLATEKMGLFLSPLVGRISRLFEKSPCAMCEDIVRGTARKRGYAFLATLTLPIVLLRSLLIVVD